MPIYLNPPTLSGFNAFNTWFSADAIAKRIANAAPTGGMPGIIGAAMRPWLSPSLPRPTGQPMLPIATPASPLQVTPRPGGPVSLSFNRQSSRGGRPLPYELRFRRYRNGW